MTPQEQTEFVYGLLQTVVDKIINDIKTGKIPENWDGHELRQLIADRFNAARMTGAMSGSRKREYLNTVAVNGL